MDYAKFCDLLRTGESQTTDFKIECDAFGGSDGANAELVKDIVAFANNGYTTSFIIVGVSNDRKGFKSVANDRLTDDNLQRLCRDSIHPFPHVELTRCSWNRATNPKHKGKTFVVIKVGRNARQCFRITRDMISWGQRYCFRKNDVWIRRGATSDLATPEEISRLVQGQAPVASAPSPTNVDYLRLPKQEVQTAIARDLLVLVRAAGGKGFDQNHVSRGWSRDGWFQVVVPLGEQNAVMAVLVTDSCNTKAEIALRLAQSVTIQDGLLLVSLGKVSPQATRRLSLALKEPWGWFCTNDPGFYHFSEQDVRLPDNKSNTYGQNRFCIALSGMQCTDKLARAWHDMLQCLRETKEMRTVVMSRRLGLVPALSLWLEDGCLRSTHRGYHSHEQPKVAKNEVWDPSRYGTTVMEKQPKLEAMLREYLEFLHSQNPDV